MSFWNILRVLVTNSCNYQCLYCHNEGQKEKNSCHEISYECFVDVMERIKNIGLKEIRFSGGEPLINKDVIKMIEWVNDNTSMEVGLATNASLINEEIAKRLGQTRAMVTIHLPGFDDASYRKVTKNGSFDLFKSKVDLLEKYNIDYSFNFVLYPEIVDSIKEIVEFVVARRKRVKLLPFIENGFHNYSKNSINKVTDILNNMRTNYKYNTDQDASYWYFENGACVKMIDSPCYFASIESCRKYGEIRLLPNLSLQTCIFGKNVKINDITKIGELMQDLWDNFNICLIKGNAEQ